MPDCTIQWRPVLLVIVLSFATASLSAQSAKRPVPESRLQHASRAVSAGKLDQAETELELILHSTPGDYRALDLLGVVRVLQRQETEAEKLFRQVVQNGPDFAPGHAHLGLLYLQMGRPQDSIPELREALRIDPNRTDAASALVHILQDQSQAAAESEDWAKALSLLGEARKYAAGNADVQYEFGIVALRLSLQEDAIDAFERTLKLRKNDALALYNLGRAFMEASQFDEARQQFAQYVKIRPDDPAGYCALGMTLAALERADDARTEFGRSIALAPGQTESYYRLGLLDLAARDLDAAAKNLRRVLDHDPTHTGALTAMGRVEFEQRHYPEAVSLLQQAITHDDSQREAHYYLGLAFARMGRKQESNEQLEIATRLEHEENLHRRTVLRISEPAVGEKRGSLPQK
jgi:tetratricopeptide (TPR) repeat protein